MFCSQMLFFSTKKTQNLRGVLQTRQTHFPTEIEELHWILEKNSVDQISNTGRFIVSNLLNNVLFVEH